MLEKLQHSGTGTEHSDARSASARPWLRALLAFLNEVPAVGWAFKGTSNALQELASISDEKEFDERVAQLLTIGRSSNDTLAVIADLARAIFTHQVLLADRLGQAGILGGVEAVSVFAQEAALTAYRSRVANEFRYADYRGIECGARDAPTASLELDDVYVIPSVVSPVRKADFEFREAEFRRRLDASDAHSENRNRLEADYENLLSERWRVTHSDPERVPVGVALAENNRWVVLGGPGVGKTTMLRFVARVCALGPEVARSSLGWGEDIVPVFIPLVRFAEAQRQQPGGSLRGLIDAEMLARGGEALRSAIAQSIEDHRLLLLLDGVDEIADARLQAYVVQAIDKFIVEHPHVRVVVTSRPSGFIRPVGDIPHFLIPNFSQDQVREFVFKWHRASEMKQHPNAPNLEEAEIEAQELLDELAQSSRIAELATNPLMLVIVALIKYERARLPQERVQVYNKAVNTLLDTWNRWRSPFGMTLRCEFLSLDRLVRVWSAVAEWTRRERNTGVIYRAELKRKLIEVLNERGYLDDDPDATAEHYLIVAAHSAGIVEERAPGVFAFWHSTFEEFLAAVELSTPTARAKQRLLAHADNPRWREVILLAVSYIGLVLRDGDTAAEIIESLLHDVPNFELFVHERCLLAAECLVDYPTVRSSTTDLVIRKLAESTRLHPYHPLLDALARTLKIFMNFRVSESTVEALIPLADVLSEEARTGVAKLLSNVVENFPHARTACISIAQQGYGMDAFYSAFGLLRIGVLCREVLRGLAIRPAILREALERGDIPSSSRDALQQMLQAELVTTDADAQLVAARLTLEIESENKTTAVSVLHNLLTVPRLAVRAAYDLKATGNLSYKMLRSAVPATSGRVDVESDMYELGRLRLDFEPDDREATHWLYAVAARGSYIFSMLAAKDIVKRDGSIGILVTIAHQCINSKDAYTAFWGGNLLDALGHFDENAAHLLELHTAGAAPSAFMDIANLLNRTGFASEHLVQRLTTLFLESSEDHLADEAEQALWLLRSMNRIDDAIVRHCFSRLEFPTITASAAFERLLRRDSISRDEVAALASALAPRYDGWYDEHYDLLYTWIRERLLEQRVY